MAIWAVALALLVNALAIVCGYYAPAFFAHRFAMSLPSDLSDSISIGEFNDFHDWPIEKQIRTASVIAVSTYERDNGKLKSVVSSILKRAPNTDFHYKVGDEFFPGSRYARENTVYGDGEVMFFTGSPAQFCYSASYSEGRVGGLGDIPFEDLLALIAAQK